jgi:predicted dehydrogenase
MSSADRGRRRFLEQAAASAVVPALAWPALASASAAALQAPATPLPKPVPPGALKFGVIGINHGHIYGQVEAMARGGGELVSVYAVEPDLKAQFLKRYPQVKEARSEDEVIEDPRIKLILSAAIPDQRAGIGIRAMRHGKDYMADKPGITTLEQLAEVRRVQKETGRIYSIMYSERFENRATVRAGELVQAGAIGRVVQTIGLGPHRMNVATRPAWFFERERFGGILCDIASHQADQFLYFTGSKSAEVVAAQVGNLAHPQYPSFEDFGDLLLRGDGGAGYIRVDWFTPDGLSTWGDGRLTILGTLGFIEIRKNVDIAGRGNGSHLFLVDGKETRYVDCSDVALPYGTQLAHDVLERTETAMSQAHCFLATELVLKAQQQARRLGSRG